MSDLLGTAHAPHRVCKKVRSIAYPTDCSLSDKGVSDGGAIGITAGTSLLDSHQSSLAVFGAKVERSALKQASIRQDVLVSRELCNALFKVHVTRQRSARQWRERVASIEVDR